MLRYHMAVVTPDLNLRRAIKRLTTSTGASADYVPDLAQLPDGSAPHVIAIDARHSDPSKKQLDKLAAQARIFGIIEGDQLLQKLALMGDPRVCSLFCHDERFDDDEFIATATKALRGEVFGLQKYFPWGVTLYSMLVKSHSEKAAALDVMLEYAGLAGVRGPVRDRIQLVCDELIMNALYHAPVDEKGAEKYAGRPVKELAQLPEVSPVRVQYGHSGRYFGVSVRDGFGSLTRERLLSYLKRAHEGAKIEDKAGGAGLGLVSVLRSTSKLIFNLDPKSATEVIALFDMELFARGKVGARSLHIFTAAGQDERKEDLGPEARKPSRPLAGTGLWALIAVLCAVLGAATGALLLKKKKSTPAAPARIVVDPPPAGAVIKLGDRVVTPGEPFELPPGPDPVRLTVEPIKPGP